MFSNKTKSCKNTSVCCANFRHCHVTCLLALIQLEGSLNFKHFWVLNPKGSKIKMSNSHHIHLFKEIYINSFLKRRSTTNQKPLYFFADLAMLKEKFYYVRTSINVLALHCNVRNYEACVFCYKRKQFLG